MYTYYAYIEITITHTYKHVHHSHTYTHSHVSIQRNSQATKASPSTSIHSADRGFSFVSDVRVAVRLVRDFHPPRVAFVRVLLLCLVVFTSQRCDCNCCLPIVGQIAFFFRSLICNPTRNQPSLQSGRGSRDLITRLCQLRCCLVAADQRWSAIA